MSVFKGRRLRYAATPALGLALIMGLTSAYAPTTIAADAPPLTESEQALKEAKKTGTPVEVESERTDSSTTFANPDGQSFRLDTSAVPVRVRAKSGSGWVAPDATLEVRADGSVGPKAAVAQLGFSGGGDPSKLVSIGRDGRSMTVGWQGEPLPKPVLDGDSAVYPEVLPGVDLRMTATLKGYREVLVVKTPEAAQNPKLKRVEFDLQAENVRVNEAADGGLSATDANGLPVFKAPPALMWDSKGAVPAPVVLSAKEKVAAAKSEGGTLPQPAEGGDPAGQPADGPVAGSQAKNMPLHVDEDSLAVVPDAALLQQSDRAAFPLYIDPSVALDDGTEHTALRSDGVSFWNWDNGDDGMGKGMGKCGSWSGYYCGPGYVQRLYFEFSPNKLVGKEVLTARFRITEPWAFQCGVRNVWLVRMDGEIGPSTSWGNKPNYADLMGDRWLSAGRGSACDPNSPAAPVEFADAADEPDENLTPTVRDFANGRYNRLDLELRAEDESDTAAWKRFRNDAVLSVDYIGKPNMPIYVGLVTGTGEICTGDPAKPSIVSDPTPAMTAITETVWGGEEGASLRIAMQTEKKETDGTWTPVKASAADPDFIERPSSGFVGDNVKITSDPPASLVEGALYRFRTWTKSYAFGYERSSTPSADCYFKVDPSAPKAPTITFGTPYSQCTSTACTAAGKPGQAGQFTFAPASGDTVTAFQYKLSTDTTWTEIAGSNPTVSITPPLSGTMKLSVKAKDAVGRWGSTKIVDFVVKEGPNAIGYWTFDETSGQAIDTSTTDPALQNNMYLAAGAQRPATGRRGQLQTPTLHEDHALQLTNGQYANSAKPVFDTRSSFTVAGWVRLDRTDGTFSMLGQSGKNFSGVAITAAAGQPWSMQMATDDTAGGTGAISRLNALNPAQAGVWTHVAATYNETTDLAKLYVNGQLQGQMTVTHPIASTGVMAIGAAKQNAAWSEQLPGRIDEVKVWQDEKSDIEVKQDSSLINPATDQPYLDLAGEWDLAKPGPAFTDKSGNGRTLTATAGTGLNDGALVLNGAQAATAAGPIVDDTGSFTVTAEVKLDNAANTALLAKPDHYKAQVIGQRTATGSSWSLWFEKTGVRTEPDEQDPTKELSFVEGTWHFGRLTADGSGTSVESEHVAELNAGVQVTGVYNAQADTITLYVGSASQAQPKAYTATIGSGELAIGKGYTDNAWGNFLHGQVKDMRLWSGAMKDSPQVADIIFGASI